VAARRLRTVSAIGSSFPLHCTANGKAILASMPESEITRIMPESLMGFTVNTITSQVALHKQLKEIAETRIAYDMEEHSIGICAIGAALRGTQFGFAAISIPIPSHRFDTVKGLAITSLLKTIADIEETLSV
jgi:DNA-binding IclR family transcriptional regulator